MNGKGMAEIIKKPTCGCGAEMQIVKYVGYYEEFNYWECTSEDCNVCEDDLEAEREWHGSYV